MTNGFTCCRFDAASVSRGWLDAAAAFADLQGARVDFSRTSTSAWFTLPTDDERRAVGFIRDIGRAGLWRDGRPLDQRAGRSGRHAPPGAAPSR